MRPDKTKLDPEYLYYVVTSEKFKRTVEAYKGGSVQGYTNIATLKTLPIPDLVLGRQKKVAKILASLDRRISLNKQTNQTLEQMAQTLFKSWFVDFDPVFDNALAKADFQLDKLANDFPAELLPKAQARLAALQAKGAHSGVKSASSGIKDAHSEIKKADTGALNDAIHPHFPSEFEHNEQLGWIPKGWGVVPVSKAIKVNPRVSLPKGTVAKFADMKAIPTTGYIVEEVIDKAYSGGAKFQLNDVLLARITPCLQNGKTALADFLSEGEVGFGSTEFIVLRADENIPYPFVACLARDENFRVHCMQSMVGSSGRQRVQNACFDAFYLALPEASELLESFARLTEASFEKMSSNSLESQSLSRLRDTLLPKLISGELEIPDTLKAVEQATS